MTGRKVDGVGNVEPDLGAVSRNRASTCRTPTWRTFLAQNCAMVNPLTN